LSPLCARRRQASAKSGVVVSIALPPRLLVLQALNKRFWLVEVVDQITPLAQRWPAECRAVNREELCQLIEAAATPC
jgi:hypothetical protein